MENYIIRNIDNRFGTLLQLECDITRINFNIFNITSDGENDDGVDTLFLKKLVDGNIKWDSCSNFNYCDGGYIHFCSPEDIINMNKAIEVAWKKAEEKFSDLYPEDFEQWIEQNYDIVPYNGNYEIETE